MGERMTVAKVEKPLQGYSHDRMVDTEGSDERLIDRNNVAFLNT